MSHDRFTPGLTSALTSVIVAAFLACPLGCVEPTPPADAVSHEPAQPGAGVARIAIVGEPLIVIPALGSATLMVQTTPNQPVRFVSMDGGELASGRGSIAVTADAQGRASATYRAVNGIIGTVRVIAMSPGASGRAEYRIEVGAPAGSQP